MARKTKKEKIIAQLRRKINQEQSVDLSSPVYQLPTQKQKKKEVATITLFNDPGIYSDLRKTVFISSLLFLAEYLLYVLFKDNNMLIVFQLMKRFM